MAAYYNEHDPKAAAWLKELIKQGLITDGEVDERSIVDVRGDDLRGFVQCHFFAGIGGWSLALRLAGWSDDRQVWSGSCPCQPFSSAGAQVGGDDPRHLWPAWYRLIRECRPPVVFGEQVEAALNHGWLDLVCDDLEREGYAVGAVGLPAASVGAPHIRQRLWFVADDTVEGWRTQPERDAGENGRPASESGRLRDVGELADANDQQHDEREGADGTTDRRTGAGRPFVWTPGRGEVGSVADSSGERRQQERRGASGDEGAIAGWPANGDHVLTGDGADGGVALGDTKEPGLEERERAERHASGLTGSLEAGSRDAIWVADADGAVAWDGELQRGGGLLQPAADAAAGFWSGCDWLPCRDGKARPVESGTFPLASGVPARVVRLRGYGNAIVPQIAAAFIRAYDSQ